jgi:hypothetical protein
VDTTREGPADRRQREITEVMDHNEIAAARGARQA